MLPKPRLMKSRGRWICGVVGDDLGWSMASTWAEAYFLWARYKLRAAA